ncbi:MAG: methyltransferase domain-containing protein [Nostocoides sp.]
MSFSVAGDAYGRFMGRFSEPLAQIFVDAAGIQHGQRAVDVGCGPGALTAVLVERLGAVSVIGVDPSASFVEAARARLPDVAILHGAAESLPLPGASVDAAVAQLVVHFMADPVAGLREMGRVTKPGGTVAACVWDNSARGGGPLNPFWDAVRSVDPVAGGEAHRPGSTPGDLGRLFGEAGLTPDQDTSLTVRVGFPTFEDWFEPFTLGVGPAGDYVRNLEPEGLVAVRDACRLRLGSGPFHLEATAWFVSARVAP